MAKGHINGVIGIGATGTYEARNGPTIDVPPNASGGYDVSYVYWVVYAGQPAYRCYVNGVDVFPDAGFLQGSATWILDPFDSAYDCVNGGCVPKTTYNTPGVYASLAACQSGCAKNSNCTGECVSAAEIAALQQAANNLKSRFC